MSSEAAPKTDGEETTAQIVLEDISGALPAVLAVGAALVYGLLIVAYSEFYSELGVRPSDVGLQYGPGIGGIAGVALLLVIAAAISLILFVAVRRIVEALTGTELARRGRRVVIAASAAVLVVCLLGAVGFAMWANDRADDVKAGKVVEPYRFLGIELLSVRADLVHVKPTGSTADGGSVLAGLHRRQKRLRYLGRNAGTLVFYDTKMQSSWHVPASMLAVHVANCETQRAEFPRCDE